MDRSWIWGVILILIGAFGIWFVSGAGSGWWTGGHGLIGYEMMGWPSDVQGGVALKTSFASNGERIYYTGISERTGPLRFQGGPMWLAMHGGGCASCHDAEGKGRVPVMIGTKLPSDIRYSALTEKEPHAHGAQEAHSPYTNELIKRAVTQGINSAGKPLDWNMPRWEMAKEDLNDLITFLKTLR